jgi:hypothetical protein
LAIDYVQPRIEFIEVPPAPVIPIAKKLAVIGIIGAFPTGPKNTPVRGSYSALTATFGNYAEGMTGALSMYTAWLQGADDFVVVKVEGAAGAAPAVQDYIDALPLLENQPVNIVILAQQSDIAAMEALKLHVEKATVRSGLRIGIVNPMMDETAADYVARLAEKDTARVIAAYPWLEPEGLADVYAAPDGFYAGLLAGLNANKSPSNRKVLGVASLRRSVDENDVKQLTLGRVSPIGYEGALGFRVQNGVSLSKEEGWSQISIRRMYDKIEMDGYRLTYFAKSEDHTPELRQAVADVWDAYLDSLKNPQNPEDKMIYDYLPTICDETNNPPEVVKARKLNTRLRIRFTYPADYIDHTITRDDSIGDEA